MLEISKPFNRSLGRLSGLEQSAAKQVVFDYMADPSRPSLALHRIDRARDKRMWTIRVDRDIRVGIARACRCRATLICSAAEHHSLASPYSPTGVVNDTNMDSEPRAIP